MLECDNCKAQFRDRSDLNRHLKRLNPCFDKTIPPTCIFCDNVFLRRDVLKRHQLNCKVIPNNTCHWCNIDFLRKDLLIKHRGVCKEYVCDF